METDWWYMHNYFKLVRRNLALPLGCATCHYPYNLRASSHDEPVLECQMCNARVQPGTATWKDIKAIVKEHIV